MANESYDDFVRRGKNYNGEQLEYFEDTHDAAGNYIGGRNDAPSRQSLFGAQFDPPQPQYNPQPQQPQQPYPPRQQFSPQQQYSSQQSQYNPQPQQPQQPYASDAALRTESDLSRPPQFKYTTPEQMQQPKKAVPLPGLEQFVSPGMSKIIAMYEPKTGADVERLIGFLRRREPAIINLNPIADSPDAQRILDFISGAAFALDASVQPMQENWFIIAPEGVTIVKTESDT